MTELERLLHNLVSAAANVANAISSKDHAEAGAERDEAVTALAQYLERKK